MKKSDNTEKVICLDCLHGTPVKVMEGNPPVDACSEQPQHNWVADYPMTCKYFARKKK